MLKSGKVKTILEDRVLILPDEPVGKTPGGILLPDTAKAQPRSGVVVAVGPGKRCENSAGVRHPMTIKVGDNVLYTSYSGADVEVDGYKDPLRVMTEAEVLWTFDRPKM